ncbi:hypothetical protein CEXT_604841 [Caerostris extrusa]|uniref:Uncharacterized protein n=1 Tax=Caerostris extrusa TaxID=172846 RepID=A0AAV4WJZ7_CAEEX|nr:hypothetical protein CEXT_604841 [Caerostris extrusa]
MTQKSNLIKDKKTVNISTQLNRNLSALQLIFLQRKRQATFSEKAISTTESTSWKLTSKFAKMKNSNEEGFTIPPKYLTVKNTEMSTIQSNRRSPKTSKVIINLEKSPNKVDIKKKKTIYPRTFSANLSFADIVANKTAHCTTIPAHPSTHSNSFDLMSTVLKLMNQGVNGSLLLQAF